jgi:hypothetical protein
VVRRENNIRAPLEAVLAMPALALQIVRFVDDSQPGFVECEFVDAAGRRHTLLDKVPIFSHEFLDAHSVYPRPGTANCEVLAQWTDDQGRELARVSTARPFGIESREGLSEFIVLSDQVTAKRNGTA